MATAKTAYEYNLKAKAEGRKDWNTAYSTDVLKNTKTEITPDQSIKNNIKNNYTSDITKSAWKATDIEEIKTTWDTLKKTWNLETPKSWIYEMPWINDQMSRVKQITPRDYTKNQSWQIIDTKTWQVTTPTWTRTDVFDTNGDWVIQPEELTGEYKSFYDSLTDIEKKQFSSIWENARKQWQDVAKAYANYMRDYNTAKTRAQEDEAYRLKQQWIAEEANVIQESQTLRKAKQSIDKLKQSIAYLWTGWVPWKSQTALNWVQSQVKEADKTYEELVNLQQLAKRARALQKENLAKQYEQQMEDLNTKLNDDIDKTIQWAFNSLIEADNNWKLDTLEEIEAFRVKMLTDLDSSITGIADANIAQRQYLIERFDNIVKEEQTKSKNKWVVNKEMSMVQGFYVDWNWDPIISSTTGKRINIPAEAPIDPVFDAKTGRLITFTTDANWQIQANVDQVIDSPTFEEQTIQNYAKLFANGKLDIWDLQNMWLWQELITDIISQSSWITPTTPATQDWSKLTDWTLYNQRTWEIKQVSAWWWTPTPTATPTWNLITKKIWNTNATRTLDEVAMTSFDNVASEMAKAGIKLVVWSSYRTREEQQKLYDNYIAWKWWIAAKPWESRHESWMAIDIYSDNKLSAPTQEQISIMAKNWFKHMKIPWDMWHFEYVWTIKVWDADIRTFNDLTPSEKTKKQNDPKFIEFVNKQNQVYNNPDATITDILKYSAWWKELWETSIQQLSKFNQALSQVWELSKKINTETTWPIIWSLRSYNPYDANAQALKAEINSLIPNIARWVYWEVWVLTDADIANYAKTIPNIKSTNDTNKLVLAMTLKTMMNWYKGQLQTLAWAWKDVSKLEWKYKEYEQQANTLLKSIWWTTAGSTNTYKWFNVPK